MRKAGIKVRRASPDFLDLASPNMDGIVAAVILLEHAFNISVRSG